MGSEALKQKPIDKPKFLNEAEEADWWASREGREFVKRKSVGPPWEGECAEGIAPRRPIEPDCQRSDRVAIARTRRNEGARTRDTQGHRLPDPAQDAGP